MQRGEPAGARHAPDRTRAVETAVIGRDGGWKKRRDEKKKNSCENEATRDSGELARGYNEPVRAGGAI